MPVRSGAINRAALARSPLAGFYCIHGSIVVFHPAQLIAYTFQQLPDVIKELHKKRLLAMRSRPTIFEWRC